MPIKLLMGMIFGADAIDDVSRQGVTTYAGKM